MSQALKKGVLRNLAKFTGKHLWWLLLKIFGKIFKFTTVCAHDDDLLKLCIAAGAPALC